MKTPQQKIAIAFVIWFALWAMQPAFAWYDPSTGRWLTRDPMGELGFQSLQQTSFLLQPGNLPQQSGRWISRVTSPVGELRPNYREQANLYGYVLNNPINFVDPFGLAVVRNETTELVIVSGNPWVGRTGNGVVGPNVFVVVPPGGTVGGGAHAVPAYATPEEALAAYYLRPIASAVSVLGTSVPLPQSAGELYDVDYVDTGHGAQKVVGDMQGPVVTVQYQTYFVPECGGMHFTKVEVIPSFFGSIPAVFRATAAGLGIKTHP